MSSISKAAPEALYPHRRGRIYAIIALLILFGLMVPFATAVGSVEIPFLTTSSILLAKLPLININHTWTNALETIILEIRLPRVILASRVV